MNNLFFEYPWVLWLELLLIPMAAWYVWKQVRRRRPYVAMSTAAPFSAASAGLARVLRHLPVKLLGGDVPLLPVIVLPIHGDIVGDQGDPQLLRPLPPQVTGAVTDNVKVHTSLLSIILRPAVSPRGPGARCARGSPFASGAGANRFFPMATSYITRSMPALRSFWVFCMGFSVRIRHPSTRPSPRPPSRSTNR